MKNALQDNLPLILSRAVEEAARAAGSRSKSASSKSGGDSNGMLSGTRGLLLGAGAAALAPVAVKGAGKLAKVVVPDGLGDIAAAPTKIASAPGKIASAPGKAAEKLGDGVGGAITGKLSEKLDEAGGPSGILKEAAKSMLPFGGGGGGKGGLPGVGKGRRMPVQQSLDIGLPLETVYNQWTQFEEWPNFMHRVTRVTQEDDCTVSFETKIWTRKREFTAKIDTQRPDERVKWAVTEGLTHTGVVTFHELGPNLTRVLLSFDVQPGGMIEKLARGARHIKRAARADLHRFKAFIETQEHETGAWRGRIEEGELVEEHDPSYDKGREYSEVPNSDEDQKRDQDEPKQDEKSRGRSRPSAGRGTSGAQKQRSGSRGRSSSARNGEGSGTRTRKASRQGNSSRQGSSNRQGSSRQGSSRARSSSGSSRGRANSSSRSGGSTSRASSGTGTRTQASRANGRG